MIQFLDSAAPATAGGSMTSMLIVMVPLFLIMYFFMIRPQKKQEKQIAAMRANLMIGDEICTNGGIIGRVANIKDDIITLEINKERTKMKVFRWAIREVVNPMPRPDAEIKDNPEEK